MGLRLNTFCGKECCRRDAFGNSLWTSRYLISMGNSGLSLLDYGHVSFSIVLVWDLRDASSMCWRAWGVALMWLMAINLCGGCVAMWQGPGAGSMWSSYFPFRVSRASSLCFSLTRLSVMVYCPTSHDWYHFMTMGVGAKDKKAKTLKMTLLK